MTTLTLDLRAIVHLDISESFVINKTFVIPIHASMVVFVRNARHVQMALNVSAKKAFLENIVK